MPIIFSTISKHRSGGARVYFQTHDDALLARVTEKVASILGRHQAYVFHEPSEVPAGRTPVVLNLSSGHGDNQPLHQPISFERVQSLHNATAPELRKPVAETLAELQDYLKEVGEPALPKNEGAIPCIPQPAPAPQQAAPKAALGEPPGIQALMCVISSLRDIAHFSDEEGGELMSALCALRDWAYAQTTAFQPSPTAQAASVPAVEREQERIAFKDAHRHLELCEVPDAWGRPMFKHSHVEASWLGWIARASLSANAVEPVAQWQKRHPDDEDGRWQNTDAGDAEYWASRPGWQIRALYAAPPTAQAGGWISVDERLPEPDEPVLAHNGKWTGVAAWMSGEYLEPLERWQDEHREFIEMMGPAITHWIPLPPPPTSASGGGAWVSAAIRTTAPAAGTSRTQTAGIATCSGLNPQKCAHSTPHRFTRCRHCECDLAAACLKT